MNRFNIIVIVTLILLFGCKNAFEKENGEIESLHQLINNTEEVLFSVDSGKVFTAARTIRAELFNFSNKYDTLDKEAAFKVADYYGNKKSILYVNDNYGKFIEEIETARKQLENLKNDLSSGAITKEKFFEYYANEQEIILKLNTKISNSVSGVIPSIDKMNENRDEVMELLSNYKKKTDTNI